MTAKQTSYYWREWQKVHKRYPDIDRHDLHIRALGEDKSSKDFTNQDLDKVLGVFKSLSAPDSLDAQLAQARQDRTRLLWKISQYQSPLLAVYLAPALALDLALSRAESYIAAIARDKFNRQLFELSATQLEQLRNTLAARLNTLRKAAGHTVRQMHELAGLKMPGSSRRQEAPF